MQEAKTFKLQVLVIADTRSIGTDKHKVDKHEMIYSRSTKLERGVGILLDDHTAKSTLRYWALSDRKLLVKLRGQPVNLSVIQIYAPISKRDESEMEL